MSVPSQTVTRSPLSFKIFQVFFLVAVLSGPLFLGAVHLWNYSLIVLLLTAPFFYYWVSQARSAQGLVHRTDLDPWIAVYFLFFCLSAFGTTIPCRTSVEFFRFFSLLAAFIAAFHYCKDRSHVYRLCQVLTLFGGLLSVCGLFQYLGALPRGWWAQKNFLSATYVNHNHFAGFLEMILPVSLGLLLAERDAAKRTLYIFLSILMATAFVFSLSRGGALAMGTGLIFFFLLLKRRELLGSIGIPAAVFCILVLAAVVLFGTHPIEQRAYDIRNISESEELSLFYRLLTWKGTWQLILHFFWLGSGPGTFEYLFLKFRPDSFSARPVFAHNDYLQLWSDCGLFTWVATLALFAALFKSGLKIIRRDDSRLRMGVGAGILAAFLALAVHSLFDFNFHIPANAMLAAVLAGILCSLGEKKTYAVPSVSKAVWAMVAMILLYLMGSGVFLGLSDHDREKAKEAFKNGRNDQAMRYIDQSLRVNGSDPEAYYLKGLLLETRADAEAVRNFDQAIRLNPYEPYYDIHRAGSFFKASSGLAPGLTDLYEAALKKDPKNPALYFVCAKELLEVSKSADSSIKAEAEHMLSQAIELDPALSEAVYNLLWDEHYEIGRLLSMNERHKRGSKGFVDFLEKHDLWKYHRKYYLQSLGIDEAASRNLSKSLAWEEVRGSVGFFDPYESPTQAWGVFFYRQGDLGGETLIPASPARLVLRAKGIYVHGAYPYIYVKIDGKTADAVYLDSEVFQDFYAVLNVAPGKHRLTLHYADPHADKKEAHFRELWIQKVSLEVPKKG